MVATRTTTKASPRSRPAKTVEEYLAAAPADKRATLKKLRKTIRAAAPNATESISYGLIGYKQAGKQLIFIGYAKAHCAVYGPAVSRFAAELRSYDMSKGTVRFPTDEPLPARLLAKMVKARVAEIEAAG